MDFLIFFILVIIAIKLWSLHTTLTEILHQIKIWNGDVSNIQRDVNLSADLFFQKFSDKREEIGNFWIIKKKIPLDDTPNS